jgi:hypothetical protein
MATVLPMNPPGPLARWRELVWPREHGSWSLALEPLALGLLVAPSAAGACLALAVVAAFFARRPLRTAWSDEREERRVAARGPLVALAVIALGFSLAALALGGGAAWLAWLLPVAAAGAVFLFFDLRAAGREEAAEVAGAAAFAGVPAALAALAGWGAPAAAALALVMLGRSVPTVLAVRAVLRAQKTGDGRIGPALIAAGLALAVAAGLARGGLAPWTVVVLCALLALRAVAVLGWPRLALKARTLGMFEAVLGAVFVFAAACAWRA